MSDNDRACFGFFAGSDHAVCKACPAMNRCQAILISHGFDILGASVQSMLDTLPAVSYRDVMRIPELVDQLRRPPYKSSGLEADLLGAMKISAASLPDLDI